MRRDLRHSVALAAVPLVFPAVVLAATHPSRLWAMVGQGVAIGLFPAIGASLVGYHVLTRATTLRRAAILANMTSACLWCFVPASFFFGAFVAVLLVVAFSFLSAVSALGVWALLNDREWGALLVTGAVGIPALEGLANTQNTPSLHTGFHVLGWILTALLAAMWATLMLSRSSRRRSGRGSLDSRGFDST
jgi:hypothetical protein